LQIVSFILNLLTILPILECGISSEWVIFTQLFIIDSDISKISTMAASKFIDPKTLSVGILGYTGASGSALATEILKNKLFKSTTLIGRRIVEYKEEIYKNSTQKQVDFDKLSEYDDVFKGLDVVYCCLGTTKIKAGADGFANVNDAYRKVDYDYIVNSAKIAKKNGESEEAITNLNFERAYFYRPRIIITNRAERGLAEAIVVTLSKPFQYFTPSFITTPVEIMAKAMLSNTIYTEPSNNLSEIVVNSQMFKLAKIYDNQ